MATREHEINVYGLQLRRLMARQGLTQEQVVSSTGLSERTVKGLLAGRTKPHARTLNRIAVGLGVSPDIFFAAIEAEMEWRAEQAARGDIHAKVDRLLANGQRAIVTGLIDLLYGQSGEAPPQRDVAPLSSACGE